jgi:hypothetical protein
LGRRQRRDPEDKILAIRTFAKPDPGRFLSHLFNPAAIAKSQLAAVTIILENSASILEQ